MADTASIIAEVAAQLQDSTFWQRYLATVQPRFHIVILQEPYLSLILAGKKTIEPGFRRVRSAPVGKVQVGDVLLLKRSGGPILVVALAALVDDVLLDAAGWAVVRTHIDEICIDEAFIESVADAKYAVLICLTKVEKLAQSVEYRQVGRAGWVALLYDNALRLD